MLSPNTLVHNRYLIARQISGDQAGAVYETIDLQTKTPMVLKQVLVGDQPGAVYDTIELQTSGPAALELPRRVEVERAAQVLAELRHPNLPTVRETFAEGQSIFLAIELVPGEDLASVLERSGNPFPVERVLRWASQLLDALDYIHTRQPALVHGDITPQNLKLRPDDQIVLLGFGLLRSELPTEQAVAVGSTAQPASFVPPEQAQGAPAGERGDLFALAATLYYLLTRVPLVRADERANALARGLPDPLPPLYAFNPQMPPVVSAIFMQALALDPSQRPASAATMHAALTQAYPDLPGFSPRAQPPDTTAVQAPSAPLRRPGLLFAIAGAVVVLLLAALVLRGVLSGDRANVEQPAPQPSTNAIAAATAIAPTEAIAAITTPSASAIGTPPAGPTVVATAADPAATRPPTPQVSSVEPQSAFVGTLPLVLTLRGTALDQVRMVRLVAAGRSLIGTTLQSSGANQLVLSVAALPQPIEGAIGYRLQLDGVVLEAPTITLRDFVERKIVRGVQAEYDYTGRIASDATGAYTRMRAEANVDSAPAGPLRNEDGIEVLRDDVDGWYHVRVRSSGDPAQVHTTGWVERWLVDNQEVPAKPTLQVFAGRVYSAPTDAAVQCGSAFDSSIYGGVEDANGRGISGARVRITSADGRNTYNVTTGRGGVYSVPGLGCTTWTVRLIGVPNATGGLQANAVTVRNLNGGRYTSAEVRFRQRP
jgi:serine/threonine protein kinase